MQSPRIDHTLRLSDHRVLSFADYGDRDAYPIFWFHGNGGSRLLPFPAPVDYRFIVPERPGFGLSDFQPGRRLIDWPVDVRDLADALGIERFSVLGLSAGGPHALVCAYALSDRVNVAVAACSPGPPRSGRSSSTTRRWNSTNGFLARHAPFVLRLRLELVARRIRTPERFDRFVRTVLLEKMPASDRDRVLDGNGRARPEFVAALDAELEGFHHGVRGSWWDALLLTRRWGFDLTDIDVPVHLWHGEKDPQAPFQGAKFVAGKIRDVTSHFFPDEGHLVVLHHFDEILRSTLPAAHGQ